MTMSEKSESWVDLSPQQSGFFAGQLESVRQTVFSSAAHAAGIILVNAARHTYSFSGEEATYPAVLWPDPYAARGHCVAVLDAEGQQPFSAFVRVSEQDGMFVAEGVANNFAVRDGKRNGIYGIRKVPTNEPGHTDPFHGQAIDFVRAAKQAGQKLAERDALRPKDELVGIGSDITARLFRSLLSMKDNITINGARVEPYGYNGLTYTLAKTLLQTIVTRTTSDQQQTSSVQLLSASGSGAKGAAFQDTDGSLAAVYNLSTFPDAYTFVHAHTSGQDDGNVLVERYYIRARVTNLDIVELAMSALSPQSIAEIASSLDQGAITDSSRLSPGGLVALEQRLGQHIIARLTIPSSNR